MGRLDGKTAIVTGGASGIGQATVALFAEEGARVVFVDLSADLGASVEAELRAAGKEVRFFQGDVSRAEDVRAVVEQTLQRHGNVDILFNNAGYNLHRPLAETPEEDWRRLLEVNLNSVFLCSKQVLTHMIQGRGGSIVNNASSLGLIGFPKVPAYSASKGAIIALTRQMACDYSGSSIRVNCVCPGPTLTPRIQRDIDSGAITRDVLERMTADVLLGRMAQPEEIARAVLFLASDEASFVTGVILPVDGGQTAH